MKQLKSLLAILLLAGMAAFTSCSDNNTTEPQDVTPSMNFKGGTGYTSGDVNANVGTVIKMGVNANSNTTSNAKLTNMKVTRVFNNSPQVVFDSTFSNSSFNMDFTDSITQVGPTKYYFKVTDKDGKTKEISLTVTGTAAAGEINTFSQRILGAQNNTTGSSFASIDGSIYNLADAKLNSAKIDWIYYYGDVNNATLAAPSDPTVLEIFPVSEFPSSPSTWSTRNITKFKDVTGQVDFNTVTNDTKIIELATGATDTKMPQLANGKVVSFIAHNGKMGLIRVDNITGTKSGTIELTVKVQK